MSSDPIVMCELLVGLGDVRVLEVTETPERLRVTVETRALRPVCPGCDVAVVVKDRDTVELTDLACFGRRTVLVWRKIRWTCRGGCGSFTEQALQIAASRLKLSDRAARWATIQVGRHGRSVSGVATDLGCGWHGVMDAVAAYGDVLVDDPDRFGPMSPLSGWMRRCDVVWDGGAARRGPLRSSTSGPVSSSMWSRAAAPTALSDGWRSDLKGGGIRSLGDAGPVGAIPSKCSM